MKDKYDFNRLTGRSSKHLVQEQQTLIHPDTLAPLKKLQSLAKNEIGADLQIISGFRSFERQEIIWNAKASGRRKIYGDNEEEIIINCLSAEEIIARILRFSALPGASRHHWGTDFDIFDANKLDQKKVQLTNSECINTGPFNELHSWLDDKIDLNQSSGFYRPYQNDNGGISPEKWHISYAPISTELLEKYTIDVFIKNIKDSNIQFKDLILLKSEFYFSTYFTNISRVHFAPL